MPIREEPLLAGSIYHIYNRSVDKKILFGTRLGCYRFIEALKYYRSTKFNVSLSRFYRLDEYRRKEIEEIVKDHAYHTVQVLAYALMPTHFHLLLKDLHENGISQYISKVTNAFTRYYNITHHRTGSVFESRFKATCMRTDEQLIHTSRYIHLNCYSGNIIQTIDELRLYEWSSYKHYIEDNNSSFVHREIVLSLFGDNKLNHQKFVEQNAEYQRRLEKTKHK
ncbi:MAG: hypothetical protein RI947_676 [Candidatus Parcubacteria bacterium]|jgi:putative transposase